jgi:putative peptide zinc metalloprotease protein
VIKDPVALKYHRLYPEQYHVLSLLDGKRSLQEIRDGLRREFPTLHVTLADIQHLITDLHDKDLTVSSRFGQAPGLIKLLRKRRRQKFQKSVTNILYLRLPGWDPERTLQWMYPKVRLLFHPWAVFLGVAFTMASLLLMAAQYEVFVQKLPEFHQFFGWPNLIYMWLMLGMTKVIHEFGHGLACKHFGGECHEMGMMLLVFMPCLYCDVSDSWMLKNKWQRIAIGAAGMYIEAVISAVSVFLWWNTEPGLLHHLCLNTFFVTAVTTVIFNANPLMRYDGYYILSDWLEIPNLRPKADRMVREKFSWYCLGIESHPDPFMPKTGRAWFVLFAIAAALYRWVIMFGITLFLYTVLKPYGLQSIGITLAVASLLGIVFSLGRNTFRIITAPRSKPMSRPKLAATLAVVSLLLAVGVLAPIPLHIEAPFLLEPHDVQRVYAVTPGQLTELSVRPGQRVSRGTVLMRLSNLEKEDKRRLLSVERKVQQTETHLYLVLDDPARESLAQERLVSIDEQRAELERQLQRLTIVAPCDGTIVAPPRIPEPKRDPVHHQLDKWHGSPLDLANVGSYIEERTHLLSVAPNDQFVAVILIDQADRNDLSVGQEVQLQFEHLPGQIYTATITKISRRHSDFAPKALSNKLGGGLSTVTDAQGRERLTSSAYQATVTIARDSALFRTGMRGQARFVVDQRTLAQWAWRYVRQTLAFRL